MTEEGDSPVQVKSVNYSGILSSAGHVKPCMNQAGPSVKAKYSWETDSEPVPWGKGEKNPEQGSEKTLKPYVYKRSKILGSTACLLHNEPTSY